MSFKYGGYAGQVLEVDLTRGKAIEKPLDPALAKEYLGGAGFCSRILYEEIGPETRPFGPENVLIIATGPLTGTLFPQASRHVIAAKSPLTEIWGEAHAAGHWGAELKFAGYDAIILRGRSKRPVYLWIDDGKAEIRSARRVWGRDVYETDAMIKEEVGDESIKLLYIGQAGENLVRFAAVMNDLDRAAARTGMGAVMGSKRLKAVAVRGSRDIPIAEPESYLKLMDELREKMLADPFTQGRADYGTPSLVELMNEIGRLPTRNFQTGVFEHAEAIGGKVIREKYLVKARADFACVQRCGRYTCVPEGPYSYIGGGPEYETLACVGSKCGIGNVEALLYAHHLCNRYGIDTCSFGGTVAWAMECYEKGIITKKDTGGLDLSWGNHESMVQLIHMVALRKGFGDVLAEGSYRAAMKIGRGAEKYVMCIKKQEIAGQDGRAQKSMGLGNATAARGADHLYAFPVLDEVGFEKAIRERFGSEYLPEIGEKLSPKYKGLMVKECEDFAVVVESVGVCKYGTMIPPTFFYPDILRALNVTTGMKLTEPELRRIGERIVNLNRMFNVREGITRKDDTLPERLLREPAPEGPPKGHVVELEYMLDEYYRLRGWDTRTGIPTRSKLKELGLLFAIKDLPRRKRSRKASR
jgi:aldehyde:ferredoxin oxidoreductase